MKRWMALLLLGGLCGLSCGSGSNSASVTNNGGPDEAPALEGSAGASALDHIPRLTPDSYDADDGPISDRRVFFVVRPETTVGQVNTALAEMGAERLLGGHPAGGLLIVEVSPGMASAAASGDYDGIGTVARDLAYQDNRLAPAHVSPDMKPHNPCDGYDTWTWANTEQGSSWGLKHIRAPFAWNLAERIHRRGNRVAFGIVDRGMRPHVDAGNHQPSNNRGFHGTETWSIVGALHNDIGIEGVYPNGRFAINLETIAHQLPTAREEEDERGRGEVPGEITPLTRVLWGIADVLAQGARVVNVSQGVVYDEVPAEAGPELVAAAGVLRELMESLAATGVEDFLVFCSAGNESTETNRHPAVVNSACAYASLALGAPQLMVVEELAPPGDRLSVASQNGGTISAPGQCVGAHFPYRTRPPYSVTYGTSAATPYAAGAALLLWALDPSLRSAAVRDALLAGARPGAGGSAPRLDLWGAVMHLAEADRSILRDLADVDDGTVDGNLREAPPGDDTNTVEFQTPDKLRGDGCVDMRDLRALRDAILDAELSTPPFDGLSTHIKRDTNDDGHLSDDPDAPTQRDAPAMEQHWSRFDLNADMVLDAADLHVLAEVWGEHDEERCPEPRLEGVTAQQVHRLLSSGDVWVKIDPDADVSVTVSGSRSVRRDAVDPTDDLLSDWMLFTSAGACDLAESYRQSTCYSGNNSDGIPVVDCDVGLNRPGNDLRVEPTLPAVVTTGVSFYSRHRNDIESPINLGVHTGGTSITLNPIPGSEWETLSTHNRYIRQPDGDRIFYPNCFGGPANEFSDCFTLQHIVTGATTPGLLDTPDINRVRMRQWLPGGRMLLAADGPDVNADEVVLLVDLAASMDTEVAPGMRKTGAHFGPGDRVYLNGGFPGDTDSNGIHRVSTVSALGDDDTCLPFEQEQLSDVFREVLDVRASARGLILTNPFGTMDPVLTIASADNQRQVEVGPRADWAAWSPDGRHLVHGTWMDGTWLVTLPEGDNWDSDGAVTSTRLGDFHGTILWSPDSARFLVVDDRGDGIGDKPVHLIEVADPSSAPDIGPHQVLGGHPAWSPTGQEVAMVRWYTDTLVCDGEDVEAMHLDVVLYQLSDGSTTRISRDLVGPWAGAPECGAVYPTDEWNVAW